MDRYENVTVGLAGAGGLGSNVASILCRSGIKTLVIADHDVVQEGNLDRQFFFRDQIGMFKVDALTENLLKISPDTSVKTHKVRLEPGRMTAPFEGVDIIVEALDRKDSKATLLREVLLGMKGVPIVACSGVAGIGGLDRVRYWKRASLHMIEDPEAPDAEKVLQTPSKVLFMAAYQSHVVMEIAEEITSRVGR